MRMWIRSLHSWRSWWSRRNGVRRFHNGWCRDTLGGVLIVGLLSSAAELSGLRVSV